MHVSFVTAHWLFCFTHEIRKELAVDRISQSPVSRRHRMKHVCVPSPRSAPARASPSGCGADCAGASLCELHASECGTVPPGRTRAWLAAWLAAAAVAAHK